MDSLVLHTYAEDAYLSYAMTTVKGRALTQVEDGQKPVHRRILHAMRQLGLTHQAKYVKSARIVGDVLGKYHPHGDSAAYEAMVRMAQKFSMRYPLVDGQGNFGSRDGDGAAAMRYTEARLTRFAEEILLSELGQDTVDFKPNYDMTTTEPVLLPSRLPVLVLNGTEGIAVGMSAFVPPHNLDEVAQAAAFCVRSPESSDKQVLDFIKGPDFPGGGHIVSSRSAIESAYLTGKATLRLRARWVTEDLARGQWQVVVTELPYQVSTRQILEEIDGLAAPRTPAGKKTVTQQQANKRQLISELIEKVVDESDKDNEVRIVITPKSSKVDKDRLLAFLVSNTSLEINIGFNGTCIGLDGSPRQKSIVGMLREWSQFRVASVVRRLTNEQKLAEARAHILEGRIQAYLNIDKVIHTIRHADEPRKDLMASYGLSEIQADDILEMRLRQLNKLEGIKLETDLASLKARIAEIVRILSNEEVLRALVASEIDSDRKKFADPRRTIIEEAAPVELLSTAPLVVEEQLVLTVSKSLWVKAFKSGTEPSYRSGDSAEFEVNCLSTEDIVLLDQDGRSYSFHAASAPAGKGDGVPLSTLVSAQSKITHVLAAPPSTNVLVASSAGYGFVTEYASLVTKLKAGKAFMRLDGATLLKPILLREGDDTLICSTSGGKMLAFPLNQVKKLDKGLGVQLMGVGEGDALIVVKAFAGLPEVLELKTSKGTEPWRLTPEVAAKLVGQRARKGIFALNKGYLLP